MERLKFVIIFCFIFSSNYSIFSNSSISNHYVKNKSTLLSQDNLQQALLKIFLSDDFSLTTFSESGGGFNGTMEIFGHQEIKYSGISENSLVSKISFDFSNAVPINLSVFNKAAQNKLWSYLPTTLKGEKDFKIKTLNIIFNPDQTLNNLNSSFTSNDFDFMGFKSAILKNVTMEMKITNDLNSIVSGQVSGNFLLGVNSIILNYPFTSQSESAVFSGELNSSVSFQDIINGVGGNQLAEDFNTKVPKDLLSSIKIPPFTFRADPSKKRFSLQGKSPNDGFSIEAELKGLTKVMALIYRPESSFKFSSFHSNLAWLDGESISMTDPMIAITSSAYKLPNSTKNAIGFVLQGTIQSSNQLAQFLKGNGPTPPTYILTGKVNSAWETQLRVEQDLVIDLGNNVKLDRIALKIGNSVIPASPEIGMDATLVIPVGNGTTLDFTADMTAYPTTMQFKTMLQMKSKGNGNNEWREPFEIPCLSISKLGGGVLFGSGTGLSGLELAGDVKIGQIPNSGGGDKRIKVVLDRLYYNCVTPNKSVLKVTAENLTLIKMIEAFNPDVAFSGEIRSLLSTGLKNVLINVNPSSKKFQASAEAQFIGVNSAIDIGFSKVGGFNASGNIDPIEIKAGELELFSLRGINTPKPNFNVSVSANPQFKLEGSIKLMGIVGKSTFISIDSKGFEYESKGNLFNGALSATTVLKGRNLGNKGGMSIHVKLEQNVLDKVEEQLVNLINSESAKSKENILKARSEIAKARSNAPKGTKIFVDLGDEFMKGIQNMEEDARIFGVMVTESAFKGFNVKSIEFKGGVSQVSALLDFKVVTEVLGKDIVLHLKLNPNISNLNEASIIIAKAIKEELKKSFAYLGEKVKELSGAFNEFGKDLKKFSDDAIVNIDKAYKGATEAIEIITREIVQAAQGPTYSQPTAGNALAEIAPGIRHFSVKVNSITITDPVDKDALSRPKWFELYGAITIEAKNGIQAVKGTNAIAWSRNRNAALDMPVKQTTVVKNGFGATKHFYVSANASNPIIEVLCLLEDHDGEATTYLLGDDHFPRVFGTVNLFNLSPGATNMTIKSTLTTPDSYGTTATISFTVESYPVMTRAVVMNAVRTGSIVQIEQVLKQGGDIQAVKSEALNECVKNGLTDMLYFLMANNINPDASHIQMAIDNNQEYMATRLIYREITPTMTQMNSAVQKGMNELVLVCLDRGLKPTLDQYRSAIKSRQYQMADLLADNGAKPSIEDLSMAIASKDYNAINIALKQGVDPNIDMINATINSSDVAMFEKLSSQTAPDITSLELAAQNGNMEFFHKIARYGISPNANITNTAIAKNDIGMLTASLDYGANPNESIEQAIRANHKAAIVKSLEYGADPNRALLNSAEKKDEAFFSDLVLNYNADKSQALDLAYSQKNYNMTETALKAGADPSKYLEQASYKDNNIQMTNLMLDYGGDPNLALKGAIAYKQISLLQSLIAKGASVTDPIFVNTAVDMNSLEMTKILVDAGANPNNGKVTAVTNNSLPITSYLLTSGGTAENLIHIPSKSGKTEMVTLLLAFGANADDGMTAAIENDQFEVVKLLLENGAKAEGHLVIPASRGKLEIVSILVEFGAEPQIGLEPSVRNNKNKVVVFLLSKGAKSEGLVKYPAGSNNIELVEILCANGDDPQPGMMPAVKTKHAAIVQKLIDLGASADDDSYISTSVIQEDSLIVKILLDNGAKTTWKDKSNNTLLHVAADNKGNHNIIDLLIKAGADVKAVNLEGNTPLHVAVTNKAKNYESVIILVEAGSDLNAVNLKGKTVLKVAKSPKIKKYLKEQGAIKKVD